MKPARAACLASAGIASSRLPSTTSTSAISSGTLARSFSMCGGTKWIMRSSFTGSSRGGAGAPIASGLKKLRGSFICLIPRQGSVRIAVETASSRLRSMILRSALLQRNIGLPDHLTPELRFLDEELRGVHAAFGDGLHLNSARLFCHVRPSDDFDHIAIDLVGQDRRRLRWRDHGVPGDGAIARQARLGNGGNLRQFPHALRRADCHDLDLAIAMERKRSRRRIEHHVDVSRDEIVEGLAQPAIGDLRRLDASEHFELDGRQMPDRANARRRGGVLPGLDLARAIRSATVEPSKFLRSTNT